MIKDLFNKVSEPFYSDTLFIIKTYMDAGYECYVVGGTVRDLLLGLEPKDIDLSTNCPIEVTNKLFKNVIPTGEAHGTVSIHINGENYEVTRYRTDVSCDGRNATIAFAETFDEDAWRRDLTINAMGYNPITNELVDPTGGMKDFTNRLIRFVGNAEERIREDHLRSIRFVRFIAKLEKFGFMVDPSGLSKAINTYDNSIVSVERIYQELDAMFKIVRESDDKSLKDTIIVLLDKMKIFERFITDTTKHTAVLEDIFKTFDYLPLLLEMKGDIQALKLSSEYSNLHTMFITFQDGFEGKDFSDQSLVKKLLQLNDGDYELVKYVLESFKTLQKENNHKEGLITLKALKNKADQGDEEPYKVTQLKVNGGDMMKLGFKGPEIGMNLNVLLSMVVKDPSLNTKEKLMEIVDLRNI